MAIMRILTLIGSGAARKFKLIPLTDKIPVENVPKLELANLPDIATGKMLGRTTAGTGAVEVIDIPSGGASIPDALQFKGVIDCSGNPNYPAADAGFVYKVSVAGKIGGASGVAVEIGDMLTCLVDATAAGNHATVGANWNISQGNIDGAVVGQPSSVDNELALFSGSAGKTIKRAIGTGIALLVNGVLSVLAAGTNGHVLTMVGGSPAWAAPSGGGGSSTVTVVPISSNTTLTNADSGKYYYRTAGTITLPAGSPVGTHFYFYYNYDASGSLFFGDAGFVEDEGGKRPVTTASFYNGYGFRMQIVKVTANTWAIYNKEGAAVTFLAS